MYCPVQVPLHLREDFSGTSLICATWCKSDVRRTALGVDIDQEALQWGWRHNGQAMLGQAESQMCLLEANVRPDLPCACSQLPSVTYAEHALPCTASIVCLHTHINHHPCKKQLPMVAFVVQVLEDLSTYPNVGKAIADENSQEPTDQAQLDQHVSRPADIICALNFSVFLLDSR